MPRPSVMTRCVAAAYAGPNERIVEFVDRTDPSGASGGLISVRRMADGTLDVCVYAYGERVSVTVGEPRDRSRRSTHHPATDRPGFRD